ncbi:MAG: hypothetical protein H2057_07900 [Alphaproteobacteria bacterium]|nr:hypothetical protein [Alphaproteobacteria bacterium]
MKYLRNTTILSLFLAGSALATQSSGPLTAAQMNELPPEIQTRVHVMMGAKKVETRIKPDGTTAEVYQEPPVTAGHVGTIQKDYEKKLTDNDDPTKVHSVPLAEAAMAAPRGHTLPPQLRDQKLNIIKYSISTLGDLKSAPFHKEQGVTARLYIPDALDFITHFDQYVPYLKKVRMVQISFTDAQEQDPHFLGLLRAFAQKVDPYVTDETSSGEAAVRFGLVIVLHRDTLKPFGKLSSKSDSYDPYAEKLGFSEKAAHMRPQGGVAINSR